MCGQRALLYTMLGLKPGFVGAREAPCYLSSTSGPFFPCSKDGATLPGENLRIVPAMSVTPEVKSRGMKFAEEQLLKHGWTQGVLGSRPYPPGSLLASARVSATGGETSLKRSVQKHRFSGPSGLGKNGRTPHFG